jgi:hypothetical protein
MKRGLEAVLGVGSAMGLYCCFIRGIGVDHSHPNGLWSGCPIEVVVEQNGIFYEVWGLTCGSCGYIEPDGFVGAAITTGPSTGWTRMDVTEMNGMLQNFNVSHHRDYIIDIRSKNKD